MSPLEKFDYKRQWMATQPTAVVVHSDNRRKCIDWCKKNLPSHMWVHRPYTDVYQDTFYFEDAEDAKNFSKKM
jgi:hypothetical protein